MRITHKRKKTIKNVKRIFYIYYLRKAKRSISI